MEIFGVAEPLKSVKEFLRTTVEKELTSLMVEKISKRMMLTQDDLDFVQNARNNKKFMLFPIPEMVSD